MTTLEEISYLSSLRSLDKQEALLDELRSRSGVLLAAASLTASFAGRSAFEQAPLWCLIIIGLALALTVGACTYILVPRRDAFFFTIVGSKMFEELSAFRADVSEIHRRLAYDLDRFWDSNDIAFPCILDRSRRAVGGGSRGRRPARS